MDTLSFRVVLTPPDRVAPLTASGVSLLVSEHVHDLTAGLGEFVFAHVHDPRSSGVLFQTDSLDSAAAERMRERFRDSLVELRAAEADLDDWTVVVEVQAAALVTDRSHAPSKGVVAAAERFLYAAATSAEFEHGMRQDGQLATGLHARLLPGHRPTGDPRRDSAPPDGTGPGGLVAGCLFNAACWLVNHLAEDTEVLRHAEDEITPDFLAEQTASLASLPSRYAARYDEFFLRDLFICAVTVTGRLTAGWQPAASVGEELCLRMLLDIVEDSWTSTVDLPEGWREALEQTLGCGVDLELLYEVPDTDDADEELALALAVREGPDIRFESWFRPFPGRTVPPYNILGTSRP